MRSCLAHPLQRPMDTLVLERAKLNLLAQKCKELVLIRLNPVRIVVIRRRNYYRYGIDGTLKTDTNVTTVLNAKTNLSLGQFTTYTYWDSYLQSSPCSGSQKNLLSIFSKILLLTLLLMSRQVS